MTALESFAAVHRLRIIRDAYNERIIAGTHGSLITEFGGGPCRPWSQLSSGSASCSAEIARRCKGNRCCCSGPVVMPAAVSSCSGCSFHASGSAARRRSSRCR
jgi:hypothetical protein